MRYFAYCPPHFRLLVTTRGNEARAWMQIEVAAIGAKDSR